ncbi:MAG: heme biosynthesis protein HemY [Alphaproteobacteria bacterium]|nr:heme biosynthesis protein HemY [Alphaproteobacteria bacterium]
MIRAVVTLSVLIAVATLVAWLADRPGQVMVRFGNYEVMAPLLVAAVGAAGLALLAIGAYRVWRFTRRAPREIAAWRAASRRARGYEALTRGLVAVAAGDPREARRQAGRADGLLGEPPLALLLSAQAAQIAGDEAEAERWFTRMLERPETEFLGLRGLLVQASRSGDAEAALDYARRAEALRADATWVQTTVLDLETRLGRWEDAQRTIERQIQDRRIAAPDGQRRRAVILAERARLAAVAGDAEGAGRLAEMAATLALDLAPAVALAAGWLAAAGKARAATKLVERAFAAAPHPDLVAAYVALDPGLDALARVKRITRLAATHPGHVEGEVALAHFALAAGLFGVARTHLEKAMAMAPTARVFRLLAEVEEREHGNGQAARERLMQAAGAAADPAWVCGHCGALAAAWSAACGHCHSFDRLAWRSPSQPVAALEPAPTLAALAGPTPLG